MLTLHQLHYLEPTSVERELVAKEVYRHSESYRNRKIGSRLSRCNAPRTDIRVRVAQSTPLGMPARLTCAALPPGVLGPWGAAPLSGNGLNTLAAPTAGTRAPKGRSARTRTAFGPHPGPADPARAQSAISSPRDSRSATQGSSPPFVCRPPAPPRSSDSLARAPPDTASFTRRCPPLQRAERVFFPVHHGRRMQRPVRWALARGAPGKKPVTSLPNEPIADHRALRTRRTVAPFMFKTCTYAVKLFKHEMRTYDERKTKTRIHRAPWSD